MKKNCILLVLLAALSFADFAAAQSDLFLLLNPLSNRNRIIFDEETLVFERSDDDDTGEGFGLVEEHVSFKYRVLRDSKKELYVGTDFDWLSISGDSVFDRSLEPVPTDLYDFSVGGVYRQTLDNNWMVGGVLRVGSASDNLFHSEDELYLRMTGALRIPRANGHSWVFLLYGDSERDIPILPGIGYAVPFNFRRVILFGIPFVAGAGQITNNINFVAIVAPIINVDVRVNFEVTDKLTPYIRYRWQERFFNRAGRDDEDDRITFEDKRIIAGLNWQATRRIALEAQAGYAFGRSFGEGDDRSERDSNNVDLENALFAGLGVNVRF